MSLPALTALSRGAGVQSTTLALLGVDGALPRLDVAIFADTGWEPAAVYARLDRLTPVLTAVGIPLHRVSAGDLRADALDSAHRFVSIPYYTSASPVAAAAARPAGSGTETRVCGAGGAAGTTAAVSPGADAPGSTRLRDDRKPRSGSRPPEVGHHLRMMA